VVRELLNQPNGSIYNHQLMTIAKLDASKKDLTSLIGIEKLPNLIRLILSGNKIKISLL
jgi:Leucine-rich repeat (LRR) protein